jgi:phage baseplate assembly protein W
LINDIYHYWSSDLSASAGGDLLTVDGTERGQQRVLRRLLTNPGDYVFHPDYGAGLPAFVGQSIDPAKIAAVIRSNILLEDAVATLPPPVITVSALSSDPGAFAVTIAYNDAANGKPVVLSFNVSS